jgi:hypothetical protein
MAFPFEVEAKERHLNRSAPPSRVANVILDQPDPARTIFAVLPPNLVTPSCITLVLEYSHIAAFKGADMD